MDSLLVHCANRLYPLQPDSREHQRYRRDNEPILPDQHCCLQPLRNSQTISILKSAYANYCSSFAPHQNPAPEVAPPAGRPELLLWRTAVDWDSRGSSERPRLSFGPHWRTALLSSAALSAGLSGWEYPWARVSRLPSSCPAHQRHPGANRHPLAQQVLNVAWTLGTIGRPANSMTQSSQVPKGTEAFNTHTSVRHTIWNCDS